MAVFVTGGLVAWLIALWHSVPVDVDPVSALTPTACAVILWSASCVIVYRWRSWWCTWRLTIVPGGEAFRLARRSADMAGDDAEFHVCRVLPGSVVWPGMMALRYGVPSMGAGARTLLIMRDSVSATDFRALSVWLRWVQRRGVRRWGREARGVQGVRPCPADAETGRCRFE